jgi:hypothetical protein
LGQRFRTLGGIARIGRCSLHWEENDGFSRCRP